MHHIILCVAFFISEIKRSYGIVEETWLDVTEYEENELYANPMTVLLLMDKSCIERKSTTELFENEIFQKWLNTKVYVHIPSVIIMLIFRMLFAYLFVSFDDAYLYLQDLDLIRNQNSSVAYGESCRHQFYKESNFKPLYIHPKLSLIINAVLLIVVCLASLGFIIHQILITIRMKLSHNVHKHYPHREKNMYLYYWFNIISELNLYIGTILFVSLRLSRLYLDSFEFPFIADDLLYCYVLYNLVTFLIQLSQLLPKVGAFPIIMQRMLGDLASFYLFLVVYMYPFSATFYHIVMRAKTGCPAEFRSMTESLYSMILFANNMIDVRTLSNNVDSNDVKSLYYTHIAFIFLVVILMLNLLIALFSHSVAKIMEHKNVIINLQRLYTVVTFERKIKLGWLFKIMKKRCFTHKDGKLFVTSVSIKDQYDSPT